MITEINQRKINKACPVLRISKLGDNTIGAPITIKIAVTADASSTAVAVIVPIAMEVIGMDVISTVSEVAATATLSNGTNDISDAVICAVLDTVTVAGTVDVTYTTLSAGATLDITTNGAADRCVAYVKGFRL